VSSVLRPHQHSIGYTEDGFYGSKDPTNSLKRTNSFIWPECVCGYISSR